MLNLEEIKPKVGELAEKYKLDFVVLFGSQATGNIHSKSDIDIGVLSKEHINLSQFTVDLYDIFRRQDIEIVDLKISSPTLMYVIVRDGVLLYENKPEIFFKWKLYAIWVWLDTAWIRRLRDRKLIEWAKAV